MDEPGWGSRLVAGGKKNFPLLRESFAPVQKIFTQVIHKKDSQTAGSVNNNVWGSAVTAKERLYEYGKDGQIADSKEVSQGYTRLLETVMRTKEDEAGAVREVSGYQYEKFSMRWRWRTGINGSGQMQQIHPLSRLRGSVWAFLEPVAEK